jgi:Flp pilus assembly protein TadG
MRTRRADDGAAAVEFALVSTLLLTLLFGIVQYGYYFFQSQSATSSAREGARLAAVGYDTCANFRTALGDRTQGITIKSYSVTYTPSAAAGNTVTVAITYTPTRFGFPFVPFISGDSTQKGTARVERVLLGEPTSCP